VCLRNHRENRERPQPPKGSIARFKPDTTRCAIPSGGQKIITKLPFLEDAPVILTLIESSIKEQFRGVPMRQTLNAWTLWRIKHS